MKQLGGISLASADVITCTGDWQVKRDNAGTLSTVERRNEEEEEKEENKNKEKEEERYHFSFPPHLR